MSKPKYQALNKQQYDFCKEDILQFCHLVTDEVYRASDEYLALYKDLIQEEAVTERAEAADDVKLLDSWCDSIVVLIQAIESPLATEDEKFHWSNMISQVILEASQTIAGHPKYDLYGALCEVNMNNLSKVPLLHEVKDYYGDCWKEASCDWIESQGRYKGVHCYLVEGDTRVVFKDGNGKVVKWAGYVDVNLTPFVKGGTIPSSEIPKEVLEAGQKNGFVKVDPKLAEKLGIPSPTFKGRTLRHRGAL